MPVVLTSSSSAYGLVCVERIKDGIVEVRNVINLLTAPRLSAESQLDIAPLLDRENELVESLRNAVTVPDGDPGEDVIETAAVIAGAISVWTIIRGSISLLARNATALAPSARIAQATSLVSKLDRVLDKLEAHLSRDQELDVDKIFEQQAAKTKHANGQDR